MPNGRMGHGKGAVSPEKAKNMKATIKHLFSYLGRYKIGIMIVLILSIGSTVFAIVGPNILGDATTEIFNGVVRQIQGGPGIDFQKIGQILITLLVLYIVSLILGCLQAWVMSGIAQKLCYRLRNELCAKLHKLPMGFFDRRSNGEILSVVANDIDLLGQSLNQSLTQLVTSITMLVGIFIMMLSISWMMTLVALLIFPLSMLFISFIVRKSQRFFQQQQDYLGHVDGEVEETFAGEIVVKAFNNQGNCQARFQKMNDKLYSSSWKSQFLSGMMMPAMQFFGNVGYAAVAVLGGWLAIQNTITVGNIQSFIQYIRMFMNPIQQIAQIMNMFQSTAAAAERVFELLEEQEAPPEAENTVSAEQVEGSVQFAHVHFGYTPDKIIINDFSAMIEAGQKVAIVGPTGAGKTTMVKLLMRFYDVSDGAILVDGYDIRQFDRGELRKLFGMVLQDTWLFHGTIMENIRYGRLDATDEEVVQAAKAANIDHFIHTLPNGYQMVLGEDATNISQGQRQLLTIARAILADPKVLILDEATSSVDTRTEVLIQKAMGNLMQGRTSFIIAHRLSTIRDVDVIFAMKDGDIVEHGSHEQLMQKGGFYAQLYNSQFEKNEAEEA